MLRRVRAVVAERRVQRTADVVLAALVGVAALVELAAGRAEYGGQRTAELVAVAAFSAPLAVRRRWPVAVASSVLVGATLAACLVAPVQGPFEAFVAVVIALYSVGVHADPRRGRVVVALGLAAVAAVGAAVHATVDGVDGGDWFPTLVWAWAAYGVGRLIRANSLRTAELETLAVALAAERDARAAEAITVERARIARELHDVVAHNVSVMSVQAMAARRVLTDGQPAVADALGAIESTGRATIDEMRRMLGVLRDPDEAAEGPPQPGLADLERLVDGLRASGLAVDVHVAGERRALPTGLELSAFRIVQEALTNVLRHAAASRASVTIRYAPRALELEIVDDGRSRAARGAGGNGLVGMRERAAVFGGRVEAGPRAAGGWHVRALLPLEAT